MNQNASHLYDFDIVLYDYLLNYPAEVLPAFENTALEVAADALSGCVNQIPMMEVRPFGLRKVTAMRDLDPSDIGNEQRSTC